MRRWSAMFCKGSVSHDRCKDGAANILQIKVDTLRNAKVRSSEDSPFPMRPVPGSTVSTKGRTLLIWQRQRIPSPFTPLTSHGRVVEKPIADSAKHLC